MTRVHDVRTLFNAITNPTLATQTGVMTYTFDSGESPILFSSLLFNACAKVHARVVTIDICHEDSTSLVPGFESSFLGSRTIYWITNSSAMTAKQQKWWSSYLSGYAGPNLLVCCVAKEMTVTTPAAMCFTLPASVDKKNFIDLYQSVYLDISKIQLQHIERMFAMYETIPLDAACLLLRYCAVGALSHQEFMHDWLPKLVVTDVSLFALSQHFFGKETAKFFACWAHVHEHYSPAFWVAFWSEQLWRASLFVMLNNSGKSVEARKAAYRLPFSFIQRDYKKYTVPMLQEAHTNLYGLDNALKNGDGQLAFELFYTHFFFHK